MTTTPIRLAVADDQTLIRLALRVLIAEEPDIELVGEAGDGARTLELVARERPDVLLLDVRMPEMDGLEVLKRLHATEDAPKVVMMTTFEVDEYVFDALASGASGFVTKDTDPAEILRAVRVVAEGESLLSPSVTRKVIGHFAKPSRATRPHPRLATLTARELEILGWVATGLSNEEIAARLVLSPATVRTHVGRTMMKLSARDRAQLVVIAYRSGVEIPG